MAPTPRYYRLVIRNRENDDDLLVLSSWKNDTNCLLTEAPSGDGQRIDPIEGTGEVGAYTWRAWDRKESATEYTITKSLYDDFARNQALSNPCVAYGSPDGSTWTAFHYGYLNAHKLETAGRYQFTVGDTDRREQQAELFKFVSERFDRVSCIIGGPIVAPTPVAHAGTPKRAWGPQSDYGPARMVVIGNSGGGTPNPANLVNPANRVTLSLVAGILPPFYLGQQGSWAIPLGAGLKVSTSAEEIDRLARPYFAIDGEGAYRTTSGEDSQPWGSFPGLEVRLTAVSGGAVTKTFPIAQATRKRSTLPLMGAFPEGPVGDYSALVANSNDWLIIAWDVATMGAQPSIGAQFDVLVYGRAISEKNPLHLAGHPLDLFTEAADEAGIPWDAASKATVKAALGALWYELRINGPMKFEAFGKILKGSAGFAARYGDDNELEFVATRAAAPASVTSVTINHLYGDPLTGPRTVIFDVSEKTTINGVDYKLRSYRLWTPLEESDRPADGVLESELIVEGRRGETAVYGERVLTYDVPGQIINSNGLLLWNQTGALTAWIQEAGDVLIDRVGWGGLAGEVEVLPTVPGKVGEYWDLAAPHQVNARVDQTPKAQRGGTRKVQIVGRTDLPEKSVVQLLDAGNLAQEPLDDPDEDETGEEPSGVPVPELTLAASTADPLTIATAEVTNAADIQSVGGDVWLEYAVQELEPTGSGTTYGPVMTSTGVTEIDLPAITSGLTIWVRGQTRIATTAQFSAWSDWISITLGPDDEGEGGTLPPFLLALSIDGSGVLSASATSTVAQITKVYFVAGAAGGAAPSYASVLAGSTDLSGPPFTASALATMAEGEVRTVGAIGEDALGNRTVQVNASITRGQSQGAPGAVLLPFVVDAGETLIIEEHDDALEPIGTGWIRRNLVSARYATGQATVAVPGAGTAALDVEYSLDGGASVAGAFGLSVPMNVAGHAIATAAIPAEAWTDLLLRGSSKGGDGDASPEIINYLVEITVGPRTTEAPEIASTPLAIENPGAESVVAGWTNEVGTLATRSTANVPLPRSGARYFYGGNSSAECVARQDIAVPVAWIPTIDAGDALVDFWGYQSSSAGDQAQLIVQFLDGSLAVIGSTFTTTLTITPANEWTLVEVTDAAVPVGARWVRLKMRMVRTFGFNNDGYFDDLEASIHT